MEKAPRFSPESSRAAEELEAAAALAERAAQAEQLPEPGSAEWERRFERDPVRLAQQVDELEAAADRSRYEAVLKTPGSAADGPTTEEVARQRYEREQAQQAARMQHKINLGLGAVLVVLAIVMAVVLISR